MDNNEVSSGIGRRDLLKAAVGAGFVAGFLPAASAFASEVRRGDISWLSIAQLQDFYRRKVLSPVEVTKFFLARIHRLDPVLHAYITVDNEGALRDAKLAELAIAKGAPLGLLHGIPISVKDLYKTKGVQTTQGSLIFKNNIPDHDEILVERLRNAGAIIIGKTNTPEFATFPRTKNLLLDETVNPWNTGHISGASSGGSGAAVAAGMSAFAVASDGGGSTRIPACFNGVFGMLPSAGRIPMLTPRSVHMSSAGPMTLHVDDAALMLQVMAGFDPRDPSAIEENVESYHSGMSKGIRGVRLAWTQDFGFIPIVNPKVIEGVQKAMQLFALAGANIEAPKITLPDEDAWSVFLFVNEVSYRRGSRLVDFSSEQQGQLTPPTMAMLDMVRRTPDFTEDAAIAMFKKRAVVQKWADSVFDNYDYICSPTVGITAPKVPESEWQQPYENPLYAKRISTPYTYIANTLGLPAVSIPCGFVDGMPIGLQIIGKRFNDAGVLRMAKVFSDMQPWVNVHPPLAV